MKGAPPVDQKDKKKIEETLFEQICLEKLEVSFGFQLVI